MFPPGEPTLFEQELTPLWWDRKIIGWVKLSTSLLAMNRGFFLSDLTLISFFFFSNNKIQIILLHFTNCNCNSKPVHYFAILQYRSKFRDSKAWLNPPRIFPGSFFQKKYFLRHMVRAEVNSQDLVPETLAPKTRETTPQSVNVEPATSLKLKVVFWDTYPTNYKTKTEIILSPALGWSLKLKVRPQDPSQV